MSYKKKVEKALEYEYEMFFESKDNDFVAIDGWFPISTDMITKPSKIDEYIKKGLLRKVNITEPKDFIQQIESKYNNDIFPITLIKFDHDNYTRLNWYEDSQELFIETVIDGFARNDFELPHIKTLEQFEQLYLSLTGKELCQVKQTE